jgi:hypothetical protein
MAIVVNPLPPPQFIVQNRVGFDDWARVVVDNSARLARPLALLPDSVNPIAPVERRYDPSRPHQNRPGPPLVVGQHTMRAHHVSDRKIQELVCDYMNGVIPLSDLVDLIGTLYQTSWIDVVTTPRIFAIWVQWAEAIARALSLASSDLLRLSPAQQAVVATRLCGVLSSSIANLRIGHDTSDNTLGQAVAPRLHRGIGDLLHYFLRFIEGVPARTVTLSFETTLVENLWGGRIATHPVPRGYAFVNGTYVGLAPAGPIVLSEEDPTLGNAVATTVGMPPPYPMVATRPRLLYCIRFTRATLHAVGSLVVVYGLYRVAKLLALVAPDYLRRLFGGGR